MWIYPRVRYYPAFSWPQAAGTTQPSSWKKNSPGILGEFLDQSEIGDFMEKPFLFSSKQNLVLTAHVAAREH